MALALNEEQRFLKETARNFFTENMPVSALRALRDSGDPSAYNREHWQMLCELGWSGILLPETYGGLDFGYVGMGAVFEECGRTLAATPLLSSVVLSAGMILQLGNETQKQHYLPALATGQLCAALALEEGNHHAPSEVATTAILDGDEFVINGEKSFVIDGHSADHFVLVARSHGNTGDSDGLSCFLVDANTAGLSRQRLSMADSRGAARLMFDQVRVPASALLGVAGEAADTIDKVLDYGRICLAAEMLGSALACFERTIAYLKEREQFGQKIGSFQALQHRASIMFTELELTKSVVIDALSAADDDRADLALAASHAKTSANEVFHLVAAEAVQMHGGIGVTDELEIGFFLKRSRMATQLLGHSGFHRDRYARLNAY